MSHPEIEEPYFIEDGHVLTLAWERDQVKVANVFCPNSGSTSLCNRRRAYCVVRRFVEVYGTECNVGKTVIGGPVTVAWIPVQGESDLDAEFSQIWIVPIDDADFKASKGEADD